VRTVFLVFDVINSGELFDLGLEWKY